MYRVLHYLVDSKFHEEKAPENVLRYSIGYWKKETIGIMDTRKFYQDYLENKRIWKGSVELTAVGLKNQLDVKYQLFDQYVLGDLMYFAIGGGVIICLMFLYLGSFVIILATVANIIFSFVIAYFLYFFVCGLVFYPFINLLAGLMLVAVGADDAFIFYDCWQQCKKSSSSEVTVEEIIEKTLNHAALAIFVTSLTTASAFFSNMISCITSIQCFALFAGLGVLVNFVLMVTWTPSIIILFHYASGKIKKICHLPQVGFFKSMEEKFGQMSHFIFGKLLPKIIEKAWFVWLFLLFGLGVGSCVIVFVTPRLKLPDSAAFQVFSSTNPLEHWDMVVAEKIPGLHEQSMRAAEEMPLNFLWGFQPEDNGDRFNPDDEPNTITLDKDFDFYSEESQLWLHQFCLKVLNASFTDPRYTQNRLCTFDMYKLIMERYCVYNQIRSGDHHMRNACCSDYKIPIDPVHLRTCLPIVAWYYFYHMNDVGFSSPTGYLRILGEPIFDRQNGAVGVNFHVRANYTMSFSYDTMKERYKYLNTFLSEALKDAPKGLKSGFFNAETKFGFYDLQDAIATGTYYSIGLSLGVAFVVMLITSRNILVCLYAIITITLAIASTVAAIVLLGWNLNIIESITVSLAVGLSIDFTIHYGVAYRLSKENLAKCRVKDAFHRVGGAVAMAALTTFMAGASVMPSRVLPYIKLGIFLMLCMTFSWTYATFFFQSLCRAAGPRGNFCQLGYTCQKREVYPVYTVGQSSRSSVGSIDSSSVNF